MKNPVKSSDKNDSTIIKGQYFLQRFLPPEKMEEMIRLGHGEMFITILSDRKKWAKWKNYLIETDNGIGFRLARTKR